MTLHNDVTSRVKSLAGGPMPQTVSLAADKQIGIEIDLAAADSLSCAASEIRLAVPALAAGGFDTLKQWAERLCRKVTYLLENIGPLELEPDAGRVLVRSTTPDAQDGARRYYEILLEARGGGTCSLRRYLYEKGSGGRQPVDMSLTHEVLGKLLTDLVDTAPAARP